MGYNHYWNRPQIIASTTLTATAQDLLTLLPALEAAGAPLANPMAGKCRRVDRSSSGSTVSSAAAMPRTSNGPSGLQHLTGDTCDIVQVHELDRRTGKRT